MLSCYQRPTMISSSTLSDRRGAWIFTVGVIAVTAGVMLHVPMFLMGRASHYRLDGMPMGTGMYLGMGAITLGVAVAAYGLLPRNIPAQIAASRELVVSPPEDAQLSAAHWKLMAVLVVALIIDVMKPATLGFTIPGMMSEYEVSRATASLVPFFALIGTSVGSVLWGAIADIYGRKASILLAAVVFVGTSICGAMPSLYWNMGMCFLMGLGAGGMLPVTYALLAEMMPSKQRGWSLVLVGGLGAVGGYFAASALSALLQPTFGWRILWLLNLPTGLILVLLGTMLPESAKFLLARGRRQEARAVMKRFGAKAHKFNPIQSSTRERDQSGALAGKAFAGKLFALSLAALCFGLIYFGLLLWLPDDLVTKGYSVSVASKLLAEFGANCIPDHLPRRLRLQCLEHQMVSDWRIGGNARGTGRRSPARVHRERKSGDPGWTADRRHQRAHFDAFALCGREFPDGDSRAHHRNGRRMQQGWRRGGAILRHYFARAAVVDCVGCHHGSDFDVTGACRDVRERNPRTRPSRPGPGRRCLCGHWAIAAKRSGPNVRQAA